MISCSSLKLSLDELKVLGKFSSVVEYVAHRLGFTVSETKAIMDRHPQVHTVRVTKVRSGSQLHLYMCI